MLRRLYHQYLSKYPSVRRAAEQYRNTKWQVSHFLHQLSTVSVTRVSGDLGSVVFVGDNDPMKISILRTLFPEGYEEEALGRVNQRQLHQRSSQWLAENDIVLCLVNRFLPVRIRSPYMFDNPVTIQQILKIDRPLDKMYQGGANKRLRNKIHRVIKRGYTTRISQSLDDLDFFYHQMYLPTLQTRHQNTAIHHSYVLFERQLQDGFLMFLMLDGELVMGSLYYERGNTLNTSFSGTINGDTNHLKNDLNIAQYWLDICYAVEHGLEAVNFMASNAWLSDGVFDFKQRWGTVVHPSTYEIEKLLFHANHLSTAWRERINTIGFITRRGEDYLQVHIDEAMPSVEEAHAKAVKVGLGGVQILKPGSSENVIHASSLQDTSATV